MGILVDWAGGWMLIGQTLREAQPNERKNDGRNNDLNVVGPGCRAGKKRQEEMRLPSLVAHGDIHTSLRDRKRDG